MQRKDRQIIDTIVHRATAIPDKCIAILLQWGEIISEGA